ncbi:NAD-dependent epimerase/dehydratase family protein [Patescibacteria group bacterium]|nr:NAD-dependent epimerase/dehydratase family protein [Patescibacteria group bacterium]
MSLYLVTGGAGYIGSHIVNHLLSQGYSVRVIDNLVSGKRSRIPNGVDFVEGDIRDHETISRATKGVDGIFHLAALPRVSYSLEHPAEVYDVNVAGTLHLLEAARKNGVRRIVFSSSSAIYGNAEILPTDESHPANPLNPYAQSKYMCEQILKQYADLFALETVSLRYFNAYGPLMEEDAAYATVIAAFLGCRRRNEPFLIHGTGEQTRDFVHVSDIAKANLLAMTSTDVGHGEIINIGSGESVSIHAIAERMRSKEGVIYQASRLGDARHTRARIEKAKTLLNWEPTILFDRGIEDVLKAEKHESSY